MMIESQARLIEDLVVALLAGEPSYFLLEVKIKPTNNIKVVLDGDNGISIEKCVSVNRALYKRIVETGIFPGGDFALEVSSPGLDEPLKLHRQYFKNVGRAVEVLLKDGVKIEGKLLAVNNDNIVVEEAKAKNVHGRPVAKNAEPIVHNFYFDNIKSTKIQIVF